MSVHTVAIPSDAEEPADSPNFVRRSVGDIIACGILLAIIATVMSFVWYYDLWMTDWDKLAQFVSWFAYLGDHIREFDLPAWNPHEPFSSCPQSVPASGSFPMSQLFT